MLIVSYRLFPAADLMILGMIGEKFDYILCDIAAIAEKVSEFSPWYKNCENNSGKDGTNHIVNVLKKSKKYLNPKGKLFFPIISLSNEKKILNVAKRNF